MKMCERCKEEPTATLRGRYCVECRRKISQVNGRKGGKKVSAASRGIKVDLRGRAYLGRYS